jgi:hypothetical protein
LRGTFLQSAGAIVQINNATEYLTVATGSGLSTAEHDQLMALPASVIAGLNATTIPVDVKKMNSAVLIGVGKTTDKWRGA